MIEFKDFLREHYTIENYLALQNSRQGIDKLSSYQVIMNFYDLEWQTLNDVGTDNYKFIPFKTSYVYSKKGKFRKINILSHRDKLLDRITYNYISSIYDLNNNGLHNIASKIFNVIRESNNYFFRADIKDFFPSIRHDILLNKLHSLKDSNLLELVKSFITTVNTSTKDASYLTKNYGYDWPYKLIGKPSIGMPPHKYLFEDTYDLIPTDFQETFGTYYFNKPAIGIPMGAAISQGLSNFYLLELDKNIIDFSRENGGHYFRYCDDICFLANDILVMQEFEQLIKNELKKINLTINGDKLEIGNTSQGFDYLGFNFRKNLISISETSYKLIKEKFIKFYIRKLSFVKKHFSGTTAVTKSDILKFWIKFALPINNSIRGFNPNWFYRFENTGYGLSRHLSIINNYEQIKQFEKWLGRLNKYYCLKICESMNCHNQIIEVESLLNWFFKYKKDLNTALNKAYLKYKSCIALLSIPKTENEWKHEDIKNIFEQDIIDENFSTGYHGY